MASAGTVQNRKKEKWKPAGLIGHLSVFSFMTIECSQSVHSIVVQWCARRCYWHKGLFCAILSERIV